MNSETQVATDLLSIQAEVDHLFVDFACRLEKLRGVIKVRQGYGWHDPNFRNSRPAFHARLAAWKDEEVEFSWTVIIMLKEDKWIITRQVRKEYCSDHPDTVIDFPMIEANSLQDLKIKIVGATKELIKSAYSVGFDIPDSGLTPEFYETLNQAVDSSDKEKS